MKKICSVCKVEKEESGFPFSNRKEGKRAGRCKECQKDYSRAHYLKKKEYYYERTVDRRKASQEFVLKSLEGKSCEDCGNSDIRVLEYDHLNRSEKKLGISEMGCKGYGLETIQKEIDKCRILCANCHRIHTCETMGYYKSHKRRNT